MNNAHMRAYIDQMATIINAHGWAVQGVGDDYAYTVGATAHGIPELFMHTTAAAQLPLATIVLNHAAHRLITDTRNGNPLTGPRTYTAAVPDLATHPTAAATLDLTLTPHRGEPEPMPLARHFAPLGFTTATVHVEQP